MKLRGTLTEQQFKEQLLKFHNSLFADPSYKRLLQLLQDTYEDFKTAYILYWIPEQGEDIYTILINNKCIAIIELDRHDMQIEPIIQTISIQEYQLRLSKTQQILLAVAQALSTEDLKKYNQ
ncbi:hypothetical protein PSTEL_22220 [Paenibacillus stellifer]|uniref:Uncharacterized protein n=1 Tax=Paenibacillus stellifer TaxID=169760 RepID=A0A089M1U6_9BACL|nr:hypothetical protein [Paenibacillus stellifer]AIQ65423.1 hypothetical protein PSTEL_22220 [Paenibacillus stellifer]